MVSIILCSSSALISYHQDKQHVDMVKEILIQDQMLDHKKKDFILDLLQSFVDRVVQAEQSRSAADNELLSLKQRIQV